jgi:hypothetical protein
LHWNEHRAAALRRRADLLLDQCRAATPSAERLNAHFEFPEIGPTLIRGAERQIRWKPFWSEREHLLFTIESREGALVEELWINGLEFRLKRVVTIKSRGYVTAEHPCGAPPQDAERGQLRLAGVPGAPRLRALGRIRSEPAER